MLWEELFTSKISSGHSSKDLNSGVGGADTGSCSQKSWQKVIYILVGAGFLTLSSEPWMASLLQSSVVCRVSGC